MIGAEVVKLLGLPNNCDSVEIRISTDDVVTVQCRFAPHGDGVLGLVRQMATYELRQKQGPQHPQPTGSAADESATAGLVVMTDRQLDVVLRYIRFGREGVPTFDLLSLGLDPCKRLEDGTDAAIRNRCADLVEAAIGLRPRDMPTLPLEAL